MVPDQRDTKQRYICGFSTLHYVPHNDERQRNSARLLVSAAVPVSRWACLVTAVDIKPKLMRESDTARINSFSGKLSDFQTCRSAYITYVRSTIFYKWNMNARRSPEYDFKPRLRETSFQIHSLALNPGKPVPYPSGFADERWRH